MKTLIAAVVSGLVVGSAFGQADLVKQRAKAIAAQNNASQGVAPAAPGQPAGQPPAAPAAPMDPVLAATLQNISSLQNDVALLKSDPSRKAQLTDDLTNAAQGTKPLKSSVAKLADSLAAAVAGKSFSQIQQRKLAQDMHAVFNGAHLSQNRLQMVLDDVEKLLRSVETPPDEIANVTGAARLIGRRSTWLCHAA